MSRAELAFIAARWDIFAHDHQIAPPRAANGQPWLTWLLIGGRGAGKTRAGAEWIRAQALGLAPLAGEAVARIALVGETEHDVREVMIAADRAALWERLAQATFLTLNEKREAAGYTPVEGGDRLD